MASNGLVANASKTSFVVQNLNKKVREATNVCPLQVRIGASTIKQEHSAKLLGITFNDKQTWSKHIHGTDGVISGLNKRLFAIKRSKNHIIAESLVKVVDGLFTSKINYGLQLYGKVRMSNVDLKNGDLKSIQKVQNKMVRFLNGKTLKDKIHTKVLLEQANLLSVNQLNAKVKLIEVWKALNIEDYPIKIMEQEVHDKERSTRAMTRGKPIEIGN